MATVTGDLALKKALRDLAQRPTGQEIDRIAVAALEPLRAETAALAPRPSLKAGVVTRKRTGTGRERREYWVSFRRGLAMRIAHLVEFGTAPHSLAKGASRRKNIMQDVPPFHPGTNPEPFFRPAFEGTKMEVIETFGQKTWALIAGIAQRVRK